jgi:3-isopropylmalate/(R)-2-methylmalate dehydratase large subunit
VTPATGKPITGGPSPSTMAEKVLARTGRQVEVRPGDYVTAHIDKLMCHEAFAPCVGALRRLGISELANPDQVHVFLDHFFPAPDVRMAAGHQLIREAVDGFGIVNFHRHAGICHQVMVERGIARPGELILGSDSHSTTYGAVGAVGAGIGVSEMTFALATGELWLQVPPTIRIELIGTSPSGVMSKDLVLAIAGRWGTGFATYKSIEFTGPVAAQMSISSRMTMANMGVELGAKFALFAVDDKTRAHFALVDGDPIDPFGPDDDAVVEATYTFDVSELEPMVALPSNPGNACPISEVGEVRIDQAFLGSCTNARFEDLAVAAAVLEGRQVHPDVRLIVTPASKATFDRALRAGHIQTLSDAGATVTASGCGACPGGHGGVLGPHEVCVSSSNRNFPGRMGSPEASIYLASPAVVAASAILGYLADPRQVWSGTPLLDGAEGSAA